MGISLDEYQKNRSLLIKELDSYNNWLQKMELKDDQKKLTHYKEDILRDTFQLVVVGEFSRGKSTFINALLGTNILPSSAKPTTTILNKITYSEKPAIKLHFHDRKKKVETISEDGFRSLVAPMDPIPGNSESEKEYAKQVSFVKGIQYAEIGRNLGICQNGVEIIDTPGTNDLDPLREEITNTIIPRSDAAILVLSAVKILSESELSLLRDRLLANDIQKIFLVINFKDELKSAEDERKVLDFAYANLKEILGDPKIYLVSAKHALNARRKAGGEELKGRRGRPLEVWDFERTGFPELEEQLADFLQFERGSIKLMKPIKRTLENIKDVKKEYIEFEKKILNSQMNGLKEKVEAFKPKVTLAEKHANDSLKVLKMQLQSKEKTLMEWHELELAKIAKKALVAFDQHPHLSQSEISQKVDLAVAKYEKTLFEEKKKKMNSIVKDAIQTASGKINEEWAKMDFEMKSMPESESSYELSTIVDQDPASDGVDDFFNSIYEELDNAWSSSRGFWDKAAVGVGVAVSVLAHGLTKLFSWGWSHLTGVDEKIQLRGQLVAHYNSVANQKMITMKSEYRTMSKYAEEQYQGIIKEHLLMIEKQLEQLIGSTELEGNEITERQLVLLEQEEELNRIAITLERLALTLKRQSAGKVGV
ncbi:dynamin family protein [Planococcus maitriensis]|uniref:Dynamin N-terminal domain-containing protein n=1 Tax=Planococcus maitriensis TaxID=221799 RepID=A0A365KA29_9BACL|nr:dynamin family protein [Planococcus maitriensis]RAZ69653.1 hypothetical protein DP119_03070 [Planococcus maitriensis]